MKKTFSVFALIIVFSLLSCSQRPLNENSISKIVPEEILRYSSGGETHTMLVKKVKTDRRQTNDKVDTVYAIVDMDDDIVHKTGYYIFTINYYDQGGWIIDKWEQYQTPYIYPLKPPSDEIADGVISAQFKNYTLLSKETSHPEEGCIYTFGINDDGVIYRITGEISIVADFSVDTYSWIPSIYSNDLTPAWDDLYGDWRGEYRASSNHLLNLNISGLTDKTISASLDVRSFFGRVYSSAYDYDLDDFKNNLIFVIYAGSTWGGRPTYWTIYFTPDEAYAVYDGDWNFGDVRLRKL